MKKTVILILVCLMSGCAETQPHFCDQGPGFDPDTCEAWRTLRAAEQQEEARRALIFANWSNQMSAALAGGAPSPSAPMTYSQPSQPAAPPVRNTSSCYVRKNSCWNACHPATFGQDVDYAAANRCESDCDADFNRCVGN
jgi:hypothetical protein